MTANQIAYANYKENARHNVVTEGETSRHNVATEGETARHNVATESVAWYNATENQRHNYATEEHNRNVLIESNRHNLVEEGISQQNADTNAYNATTNRMGMLENQRHNKVVEQQGQEKLDNDYYLNAQKNIITKTHNEFMEDVASRETFVKEQQLKYQRNESTHRVVQGYLGGFVNAAKTAAGLMAGGA